MHKLPNVVFRPSEARAPEKVNRPRRVAVDVEGVKHIIQEGSWEGANRHRRRMVASYLHRIHRRSMRAQNVRLPTTLKVGPKQVELPVSRSLIQQWTQHDEVTERPKLGKQVTHARRLRRRDPRP